uniref:GAGE domain-containing protein n=1 Tax=Microcebus murinus TaxID=30608 RepID=A0A8C5Y882_MICMU
MSHRGRSTYRPRPRRNDQEFCQRIGAAHQPRDEEPPQEEPPTGIQGVTPGQKRDAGAPEIQGPDLEADTQELSQPETGVECLGPDVKEESLPTLKPTEVLEAGIQGRIS